MRADKFLAERFGSRTKAAEAIEKGWVLVNGKKIRPKDEIKESDIVSCLEIEQQYVSNGGYKLARALEAFHIPVKDGIFVDIGASTGGFTDCLLQNGAKKVFAVDVGSCLLHEKIALDDRVIIMDETNARYLKKDDFLDTIDAIVTDVSFISLRLIFPVINELLNADGYAITLIKPQFECENKNIGKSGIVHLNAHREIVLKVTNYAKESGLVLCDITNAPIRKGKNIEYVALWKKSGIGLKAYEITQKIDALINLYRAEMLH